MRIQALAAARVITPEIEEAFHAIRHAGNRAAHADAGDTELSLSVLRHCFDLGRWLHLAADPDARVGPFVPPKRTGTPKPDALKPQNGVPLKSQNSGIPRPQNGVPPDPPTVVADAPPSARSTPGPRSARSLPDRRTRRTSSTGPPAARHRAGEDTAEHASRESEQQWHIPPQPPEVGSAVRRDAGHAPRGRCVRDISPHHRVRSIQRSPFRGPLDPPPVVEYRLRPPRNGRPNCYAGSSATPDCGGPPVRRPTTSQ